MKKGLIIGIIILASIIGIKQIIDVVKLRNSVQEYIVVDKEYNGAYITTTVVMSGKTFIPITNYHNEEWLIDSIGFDSEGTKRSFTFYVSEEVYNNIKKNTILTKEDIKNLK